MLFRVAMNISRILIIVAVVLAVLMLFMLNSFFSGTATQRDAIGRLTELGVAALIRGAGTDCYPGFSFDRRGPRFIEDLTGPTYFGQVTDVWFNEFDDQQIIDSIPSLKRFGLLARIGFDTEPSQEVTTRLRMEIPSVTLVGKDGKPLP
jgi:hypothetical protein